MDLSEHIDHHRHTIQSADHRVCLIAGTSHQNTLCIGLERINAWPEVRRIEHLTEAHIARLITDRPELLIIGSGERIRYPDTQLLTPLVRQQVGLEVMDNRAAARTYNVLLSEDRRAVCLMILEGVEETD